VFRAVKRTSYKPKNDQKGVSMNKPAHLEPQDRYNMELLSNVHPGDWKNPKPRPCYDFVVIGGGTAGLVAAAGASGLGAKVALIEKNLLGGDCLNVGCVPSKSLIRSSRAYAEVRDAPAYGIRVPQGVEVDFSEVMERMRKLRARIARHDSARRFRDLGIDVFLGKGRFSGEKSIDVSGKQLHFKKALIATGARAIGLPIKGLTEAGYLTNETIFSLTERPTRLAVIGGGPLGCELAQAFQRLGSSVTVIEILPKLLGPEDEDASTVVARALEKDGIRVILNATITEIKKEKGVKKILVCENGKEHVVLADEILLGAGRAPNVESLDLEVAGVEYDLRKGILVNDRLQTTNPDVFAAGDVCLKYKFTHMADASARIVIQNALFSGRKKISALTIPWCTYTDPEVAHVGMTEKDIKEKGLNIKTIMIPFNEVDRAILDGEEDGFLKVYIKKGSDKILGATIVARHAGEMIGEIALAISAKVGLKKLATVIHPYPTQAEAIKKAADEYNRLRLTPFTKRLLLWWMKWSLRK